MGKSKKYHYSEHNIPNWETAFQKINQDFLSEAKLSKGKLKLFSKWTLIYVHLMYSPFKCFGGPNSKTKSVREHGHAFHKWDSTACTVLFKFIYDKERNFIRIVLLREYQQKCNREKCR